MRIVYIEPGSTKHANGVYTCKLEPREIIDQVMVDGRVTYQDFLPFKRKVMKLTGLVEGQVTRSLLYEPLKEFLVEVP